MRSILNLQPLLDQGLDAAGREILSMARRMNADVVVLDGCRGMRGIEGAPLLARQFLYDVGTTLRVGEASDGQERAHASGYRDDSH